jgi:hypothetical protein
MHHQVVSNIKLNRKDKTLNQSLLQLETTILTTETTNLQFLMEIKEVPFHTEVNKEAQFHRQFKETNNNMHLNTNKDIMKTETNKATHNHSPTINNNHKPTISQVLHPSGLELSDLKVGPEA